MKPLVQVKAADLMEAEVITLFVDAPITEAVQTFEECGIKGAPVLDAGENPVGVITTSDIAQTGHLQGDRITLERGDYYLTEPSDEVGVDGSRRSEEFFDKENFSPAVTAVETVGDWMTPRVVSVYPDATIPDVCKTMMRQGVHRVMVVRNSKILGVISSIDIVGLVAKE